MNSHRSLAPIRVAFSFLTLSAIGVQLSIHLRSGFSVVNFFSYFTNLANLLAAGMLLTAAFNGLTRRPMPERFVVLRGASTVAMAVVGIVFAALLRNEDLGALRPWVNIVLHYVMPVAVLLDWALDPPDVVPFFRRSLVWLVFPALYLVYTLARGAVTGWYPYPFLNPSNSHGYLSVTAYCLAITAVFFLTGLGIRALARPNHWQRSKGGG